MSLNNALFLVNRNGTNFKVSGSDIGTKIQNGDQVLVQQGSDLFKATYGNSSWNKIGDNDLILAWDGSSNRKVKGSNFKALFASASISSDKASVNTGVTFTISWNCSGGVRYRLSLLSGTVYVVDASGSKNFYSSTAAPQTFTIEVIGSDDSILISDSVTVNVTQASPVANLSTNYTSRDYGQRYTITWSSSNGTSYSSSWSSNPGSSGSRNYYKYPTSTTSYTHTYTVTNSMGSDSKSVSIRVTGYSLGNISFSGVPSKPTAHSSSQLSPNWSNSSKLTNLEYTWTLSLPSDSTSSNINYWVGWGIGSDSNVSTDKNPTVNWKSKTHKDNGAVALNTGFGQCPSGITLTLQIKNKDNNETKTYSQNIKIYPPS